MIYIKLYYISVLRKHSIDLQNFTNSTEEVLPDIQCPYEPPELCAAGDIGLISNQMMITGLIVLSTFLF